MLTAFCRAVFVVDSSFGDDVCRKEQEFVANLKDSHRLMVSAFEDFVSAGTGVVLLHEAVITQVPLSERSVYLREQCRALRKLVFDAFEILKTRSKSCAHLVSTSSLKHPNLL